IHTHRSETISVVEDGVVSSWEPIDKGKTKISRVAHHIEDDLVRRHRTDINFFEMQDSRVLLDDVNFRFANLNRAGLCGASLSGADLSYADLSGADLSYTDLSYTDLTEADLNGANLNKAYLRRAVLIDANLVGADLSGADLSCAICIRTN